MLSCPRFDPKTNFPDGATKISAPVLSPVKVLGNVETTCSGAGLGIHAVDVDALAAGVALLGGSRTDIYPHRTGLGRGRGFVRQRASIDYHTVTPIKSVWCTRLELISKTKFRI